MNNFHLLHHHLLILYLFTYLQLKLYLFIYLTTTDTLPIYLPNVCLLLKFHAIHGDVVPSGIWHIQHMETIGGTANVFFLQNDKLLTWHFHLFFIQSFFASRDKVTYLAQMPPSATIPIRHSKIQRNYLPGTDQPPPSPPPLCNVQGRMGFCRYSSNSSTFLGFL